MKLFCLKNYFTDIFRCCLHAVPDMSILSAGMISSDFPELISFHIRQVLGRIEQAGAVETLHAMQRQLLFSSEENNVLPCELTDPLGASRYQITPRAVHQYKNRVLLLTTGRCFANCRYCFRRCSSVRSFGFITDEEVCDVCRYLEHHAEVQEILFSGGDCLTAADSQIEKLIHEFRSAHAVSLPESERDLPENRLLVRICTRAPVFAPERITPRLVDMFRAERPLWVIPHINHPAEISVRYSPETAAALSLITDAGIPVQSQTVLLKGVNDSVPVLAELFHMLTVMGIKPGYLFQGDLAPGTSHFRVPLQRGIRLYEELRRELSGLSVPVYAVDLPGGGGKVNLLQADNSLMDTKAQKKEASYEFTDRSGRVWLYPF